jgi:hypothetical protein
MKPKINFENLYCGSISKIIRKENVFWHLTWKKNKKTVTRYIRLDEVKRIQKGIKAYQKAKADLQKIATANLTKLMEGRTHDN